MPLYRRREDIPETDLAAEMKVRPPSSEEGTTMFFFLNVKARFWP